MGVLDRVKTKYQGAAQYAERKNLRMVGAGAVGAAAAGVLDQETDGIKVGSFEVPMSALLGAAGVFLSDSPDMKAASLGALYYGVGSMSAGLWEDYRTGGDDGGDVIPDEKDEKGGR